MHPNDRGNILLRFREQGFATIGGVFQHDTVDAYLDQIKSLVRKNDVWWNPLVLPQVDPIITVPAKAPRLLEILRSAFMPWIDRPEPVLMSPSWLIKPSNPDEKLVHDWHKDADHIGATCIHGYTPPAVIHTAIYFADMTPDLGPTYVIPRSHRDATISPYNGAKEEAFLPSKADVVIWDQRLWHRGSARRVDGVRIAALFPFYGVPTGPNRTRLCEAQRAALSQAKTDEERILFGGPIEA